MLLGQDQNVKVWGSTETCPIQGLYVRERLFTTQGHLGGEEAMVRENIEEKQKDGTLERDPEVERAKERAELECDGGWLWVRCCAFWQGGMMSWNN